MKNVTKYITGFLVLFFLFGEFTNGYAQPVPENPGFKSLVVDQAGIFSLEQTQDLERELIAFSDSTSNQIVIVTLTDLMDYQPWEVAQNIGKTWGVGQSDFNNGIVILVKPKMGNSKGEVFIATGYGLEGALPDATTKMIVEREMIPYFKQNDMFGGVKSGLIAIKALAVGEYNSDEYANKSKREMSWFPILFILIVLVLSLWGKARSAKAHSIKNDLPFWTAFMLMNQSRGHGGSYGNFTSGGGGFGGGGFGGFGGGGFGGGGAGGSW